MKINPALIGRAGELLVAAELMRRGVEVATPASAFGVDILAYLLHRQATGSRFVPIQVKANSSTGYAFLKDWFTKAPGVVLVQVWHVQTTPEFFVFDNLERVEEALGDTFATSPSWQERGVYTDTNPAVSAYERMQLHRNRWERIIDQLLIS